MKTSKNILYTYNHSGIFFYIPKKNGNGYLKAPLGGRFASPKYLELNDTLTNSNVSFTTISDIDGYLSIDVKNLDSAKADTIARILNDIFPYTNGLTKLSWNDFFSFIETDL